MGFLFSSKKEDKTIVILDIGSGSVGGAIVLLPEDKNNKPVVKKIARNEIHYNNEKLRVGAFTKSMLKALNLTLDDLYNKKIGAPDKIICVVAAPWYSSETRTVKLKKNKTFIFSEKIADQLVGKEVELIDKEHKKENKTLYSKLELIEQHIMNVSLNGYKVDSPIGMKTSSVEMNMVVSFSQKFFLDKIRKVVSKTFHDIPLTFSSFMTSSYFAVRDKYISPDSYLLLDVGGEVTEVGIVSKGILRSSISFPFGKKTIFKYISTKLEIELRDAKELFNLYSSGHLPKDKRKKYEPLFKSIENSWSESFKQSVANLPHLLALPSTVFLTADNDVIKWFSDLINNGEYIKSVTIDHKCTVVSLKGNNFLEVCEFSNENEEKDPFLIIEIISMIRKNKIIL